MDRYRYDRTISPEELRLSRIDVRKEVERQGKHELAELLLSSLERTGEQAERLYK